MPRSIRIDKKVRKSGEEKRQTSRSTDFGTERGEEKKVANHFETEHNLFSIENHIVHCSVSFLSNFVRAICNYAIFIFFMHTRFWSLISEWVPNACFGCIYTYDCRISTARAKPTVFRHFRWRCHDMDLFIFPVGGTHSMHGNESNCSPQLSRRREYHFFSSHLDLWRQLNSFLSSLSSCDSVTCASVCVYVCMCVCGRKLKTVLMCIMHVLDFTFYFDLTCASIQLCRIVDASFWVVVDIFDQSPNTLVLVYVEWISLPHIHMTL